MDPPCLNLYFLNTMRKTLKWKSISFVWLFATPWNSSGQNTGVGSLSLLQGSSHPRDWTQVSCIARGFFTSWATREARKNPQNE